MKTFNVYLEDKSMALVPKGGTLEDFLRSLEGKTIKQILDDSSYMNLYMGNKYGIGGAREGSDKDATDFANKLVRFVNRDIKSMRPEVREYETDQFKEEHDYESYREARSKKARLGFDRIKARKEDDGTLEEIQNQIDELQDFLSNHPYQRGMSMIEREYDQAVQDYHNTPLTVEYLTDDGSKEYDELVTAFAKLGGESETVIDV
tara:strand:- start:17 stop:631 length:615 start_codon:yes stop_codon:yes gene_type:complete